MNSKEYLAYTEDTGINRVKSFLIGASDGQTCVILDYFLRLIDNDSIFYLGVTDEDKKKNIKLYLYDFADIESDIDDIIGFKHDYKVDDPDLEKDALKITEDLYSFIRDVNKNPQKYFECIYDPTKDKKFYWVASCDVRLWNDRSKKIFLTQEECYKDMLDHALENMKCNIGWTVVINDNTIIKKEIRTENGLVFNEGDMREPRKTDWGIRYGLVCHPNKIQHQSYNGIYTYEIKTTM